MMTYLQLGRMGRLGNQMFEIAGTIGIARKSGQEFAFPEWKNYDHKERFGQEDINVQSHFINPLPVLEDPERYQFQEVPYYWGYRDEFRPQGNWNLNAHMQSEKFFKYSIEEVRYYFKMKTEDKNNYVAIHYRAGDYEKNENAYHPRLTLDYYEKAMEIFPEHKFLVFTDDKHDALNIIPKELNFKTLIVAGDYLKSFSLMKSCRHFICGNSSYSLMAAILADQEGKRIVCPKKWFGAVAGLDTSDLYPEGSIII